MPDNAHGVPILGVYPRVVEISQGEPPQQGWPVDAAVSACGLDGLEIRAASVRGFMHRARNGPRQDAFAIQKGDDDSVLLVVCDGVGSLQLSDRAAQLICDTLPGLYLQTRDWNAAIAQVNDRLRELEQHEQDATGSTERLMASTVVACRVAVTATGATVSYARIGDVEMWTLSETGWTPLVGAAHDDDGLYTTRTSALPSSDPVALIGEAMIDSGALFLFTDGVSVPLSMGKDVQDALAEWWTTPPDPFTFARQVGFARRSFMDDRTAIGVWLTPTETVEPVPATADAAIEPPDEDLEGAGEEVQPTSDPDGNDDREPTLVDGTDTAGDSP